MPGLFRSQTFIPCVAMAALLLTAAAAPAQRLTGTENGEWRYLGGDAGHTRSSALDQIDGDNFSDLEVAWIWRGDNFGPNLDYFNRATPIYVDGVVYTIVVAAAAGGGHRSGHRRDALDLPRAGDHPAPPLAAAGLRQGRRLRRGERARRDLRSPAPPSSSGRSTRRPAAPWRNWGGSIPLEGFPPSGGLDLIPPLVVRLGPLAGPRRPATTRATASRASWAW